MKKRKTLLPITILCSLAIAACTPANNHGKSSAAPTTSQAVEVSSTQPESSEDVPSSIPDVSSEPAPSSQPSQSSEPGPSSSEDPIEYGVSITNKDEFNEWHAGDNDITLAITLTPAANVKAAINSGELVVESSDPSKVVVNGLICTANEAGEVTITAKYHGKTDSVTVNVQAEDIKTIAEIITTGKKNDKITFKGYYMGHNSRVNYLGSDTYPYVYVGDGQQSMILYCMSKTFLEGIEVGDLVKVKGTYSPYNGLPETASGSVTKFIKVADDPTIVRPEIKTIDAEHPNFTLSMDNIGSRVHVEGGVISKVLDPVAKSRTDIEPAGDDGTPVTTNYFERSYKFKVGEAEYDLFINERYCAPSEDITNLSVGDSVSFDAFVNIPAANTFNFAMPLNLVRTAGVKDPVESITLEASRTKMYVGTTLNVTAKVLPETALQTVEWTSSDNEIATVSDAGIVSALKAGTVTITAKTVGTPVKEETIEFTIYNPVTEPVHAGTSSDPYNVDDAVAFAGKLADKAYSDNEVYVQGKVVSSEWNESYGNFTIWLEDAIGAKAFELYSAVLDETVFTDADIVDFYKGFTKDADDKNVGNLVGHTVVCHGYAQKYGTTLELTNKTIGTDKVYPTITSVSAGVLSEITLPETGSVAVGADTTLLMTVSPIDASKDGIVWSSSNNDVATVDQNGKVSGIAAGEAVITAKFNDEIKDTCTVTVSAEVIKAESISLDKTTVADAKVGDEIQLTATVTPSNAQDEIVWSVSDDTKASVNNGLVKILDEGTITVTVTAGEASANCTITATYKHGMKITDPLTVAEAVAMVPNASDKTTDQYYVKGVVSQIDENNFAESYKNATFWLYNGETVKGFEGYRLKAEEGVDVSNFRLGAEVTIKCIIQNYKGTIENSGGIIVAIEFTAIPATGITLNKNSLTLNKGDSETLEATIAPENSTDEPVWSSSDETVATVNANGKVTAVAAGTATITAKISEEMKAECVVTITDEAPTKVILTDATLLGYAGTNIAYAAGEVVKQIGGITFASDGCGAYGSGIQMRTNDTTGTSKIYNKTAFDFKKLVLEWNAGKPVDGTKEYLTVEFSNDADFSTLVGSKVTVKFNETTKKAEVVPSADATYFRIAHNNKGAVYLDGITAEFGKVSEGSDPVEIAQPSGSFSGYMIADINSADFNVFTNIALGNEQSYVEIYFSKDAPLNAYNSKTQQAYSFDKTTGLLTIALGGNYGNLTATFDEANNKLTNVGIDGAASAMLKNNGTAELAAAGDFWNCDGTTAELQALFLRRYRNETDGWSKDTSNTDRFTSDTTNFVAGTGAMKVRPYAGTTEGKGKNVVGFSLAQDFATAKTVKNIGFWVYNSSDTDINFRIWVYTAANLSGAKEIGTLTAKANGWTYCRMGFDYGAIYNFNISNWNGSANALIYDNICLF